MTLLQRVRGRWAWSLVPFALIVVALFVGVAAWQDGMGLPLDDGWIHQTYARNLAHSGRWEFVPGVTSSGSTAPLWTLLLALGYALHFPYLLWSYGLGAMCLAWLAWSGALLWEVAWPGQKRSAWLASVTLLLSWPLVWAAGSGMETILFAALALSALALYLRQGSAAAARLGLLSGLLVLTRPEGVLLLALLAVGYLLRGAGRAALSLLVTAALPLVPYFLFNFLTSGQIWPNTLYAKQAEYTVLLAEPLLLRLLRLSFVSLGGGSNGFGMSAAHLLLVPGLLLATADAVRRDWRRRQLRFTLPLLWAAGHVFMYAWRLPVTYQHGRYLWPVVPLWIVYGLAGWLMLWRKGGEQRVVWRVMRRSAALVFLLMLLFYLALGAEAYAQDVAFIENEMVDVAYWVRDNTAQDALIAAHDIGAIGYFAERPLLDLAGLVSPEIVTFLDDEQRMATYVAAQKPDYVVTAPGWPYEQLLARQDTVLVYSSDYAWTVAAGLNNTSVYRLAGGP